MKNELVVHHLESHLGRINQGWSPKEGPDDIRVVHFRNQPQTGASTFVALGLSDHELHMPRSRTVRQELVFSAGDAFDAEQIASFIGTFGYTVASRGWALLRGEVIGPSAPIIRDTRLNAVYAAIPVLFEDSFRTLEATAPATVFVWIIPLHASEADYVARSGWNAYEDRLEATNPDLLDLNRSAVM